MTQVEDTLLFLASSLSLAFVTSEYFKGRNKKLSRYECLNKCVVIQIRFLIKNFSRNLFELVTYEYYEKI